MQLINALNGYQYVLKTLRDKEKYSWSDIIGINKDERGQPRYYVVIGDSNHDNIFIKFSREPYKSGEGGFRESVNTETGVKLCLKHNVKRMFWVYPDGKIYWILLNNLENDDCFLKKATKRTTSIENKNVHTILLKDLKRY